MAITIAEDLIADASYSEGWDSRKLTRGFIVSGLTSGGTTTPASTAMYRAVAEVKANIVDIGDPLVGDAGDPSSDPLWYWRCEALDARPLFRNGQNDIAVIARYVDLGGVIIRQNGNVIREMTRLDMSGTKLEVKFDSSLTTGDRPHAYPAGGEPPWPAEVQRASGRCVLEFERHDFGYDYDGIEYKLPDKVNSQNFQSTGPRTWLCTGVKTVRLDPFKRMLAHEQIKKRIYTFEFIGQWLQGRASALRGDPILWWRGRNDRVPNKNIDPKLDRWPEYNGDEVASGNGWKWPKIQPEFDFNAIDLPPVYGGDEE